MRRLKVSVSLLAGIGAVAIPAFAAASGLYVPDTGTTARARAGAFCVDADDPLAMYYNPAGLADQHQRNQFLFDVTVLYLQEKFQRNGADIPADGAFAGQTATNSPPPQIVPDIIYTHSLSNQFTLGGGIHAPAGARWKFRGNGPQRFSNTELYLKEAGIGITAGYRPVKYVAIGLTVETLFTGVQQAFTIEQTDGTTPPSEAPAKDVGAKLDVQQTINPTGILGIKVTPMDNLEFGFAYRPSVQLNMPGTLNASIGSPEKVHFHTKLASILRLGARYVTPKWDAELDFVQEDWGVHKEDKLTADDGNFFGTPSQSVTRNWQAGYSVRLGSTFTVNEKLHGMGGVYYETSAVPTKNMDVGSYDAPKVGINLGAKYDFGTRYTLAGNFSHTIMSTVKVSNSEQRQQSPFPAAPSGLTVIGNGTYSGDYNMLGVSLLTKF
jgi:long-chain fatty acid transport protein